MWLSGVCCPYSLSEDADLAGCDSPTAPLDLGDKIEVISKLPYPSIVLQPAVQDGLPAQSWAGLDGPLSSESDKLSKVLRDGLSDLKDSSRSANLSSTSQKLKSDTSGSIDWERNWEKRKPRRKHDVSEASNLDVASRIRVFDHSSASNDDGYSKSASNSEDESDEKSCSYLSQHDAQFHALKRHTFSSCPELHRQMVGFGRSLPRSKTRDRQEQISQLRSSLDKEQYRPHFRVRNIVTKRFRSLGKRIRRSGSSTFSIRSEFPAPPDSKERRLLARDSSDIWPSSGEETPLFNTPESDITNSGRPHPTGHHLDPLAMASMMIATAELDRLSRTSGSSTGFSGSSPTSRTPFGSGVASPNNETSLSDSAVLDMSPTILYNSPSSSGPQSGIVSPVSRPPQRRGQRRRGQRSRLSEVTTPDEIGSPAEPAEEFAESSPPLSCPQIEPLPECSATPNISGNEDSLYPKPLAINREATSAGTDGPSAPTTSGCLRAVSPEKSWSRLHPSSGRSSSHEESVSPPTRVSSIGQTPESMYGPRVGENANGQSLLSNSFGLGITIASPGGSPDVLSTEPCDAQGSNSIATVENDGTPTCHSNEDASPDSCHPDTWTETQGEPGNLDPFCPPGCLESRHSSHGQDGHLPSSGST
ncbi:hypothetical protein F4677DRAFT_29224 [Hypoxylon crocopeplum]|nr:hypothetical protein F4677DRAFT_29224 [Hypoxylon crocopeplum]